jgi:alkanesulfonate monooxygenase SsuD/methylene tetrahydromethanopterin reductase-like flavin-dependent oxidoreductase (luciferase family)
MAQHETNPTMLTSSSIANLPLRERVGLTIQATDATTAIGRIREAEEAGIRQVWMTQSLDTLTLFAAAAMQTTSIRLGTSIVQVYPRHPLVMALQAATINDLAPGRLRLGVGTVIDISWKTSMVSTCRRRWRICGSMSR